MATATQILDFDAIKLAKTISEAMASKDAKRDANLNGELERMDMFAKLSGEAGAPNLTPAQWDATLLAAMPHLSPALQERLHPKTGKDKQERSVAKTAVMAGTAKLATARAWAPAYQAAHVKAGLKAPYLAPATREVLRAMLSKKGYSPAIGDAKIAVKVADKAAADATAKAKAETEKETAGDPVAATLKQLADKIASYSDKDKGEFRTRPLAKRAAALQLALGDLQKCWAEHQGAEAEKLAAAKAAELEQAPTVETAEPVAPAPVVVSANDVVPGSVIENPTPRKKGGKKAATPTLTLVETAPVATAEAPDGARVLAEMLAKLIGSGDSAGIANLIAMAAKK